jgi:predicted nucleic acid-binding Zn ribbon protein
MASKRSSGRRSQPQEIILKVSCGVCGVEVPEKHPLCEKCREIPEYRDELNRRIAKAQEILFSS